ncbi:MAG: hypothetical protein KBD63_05715, partial [Bacteriovoracaceae bacterium]|nr:hypothetical protein [Bacteriovoracaceae bacterium]
MKKVLVIFLSLVLGQSLWAKGKVGLENPLNVKEYIKFLNSKGMEGKDQLFTLTYPASVVGLDLEPKGAFEVMKHYNNGKNSAFEVRLANPERIFVSRPVGGVELKEISFFPTYIGKAKGSTPTMTSQVSCAATFSFKGKDGQPIDLENFNTNWSGYSYEVQLSNPDKISISKVFGPTVMVERSGNGTATAKLVIRSHTDNFVAESTVSKIPECGLYTANKKVAWSRKTFGPTPRRDIYSSTFNQTTTIASQSDSISTTTSAIAKEDLMQPAQCVRIKEASAEQKKNMSKDIITLYNTCNKEVVCKFSYESSYHNE